MLGRSSSQSNKKILANEQNLLQDVEAELPMPCYSWTRTSARHYCFRLDMHPNAVVLCGGDLNRLDMDCLSTSSGLVPMVNFATRGTSILGNCFTNQPELFNDPLRFQALIKTDHWGVILPPGETKLNQSDLNAVLGILQSITR